MKKIFILLSLFIGVILLNSCTEKTGIQTNESNKRCEINVLTLDQITNYLHSEEMDSIQFIDIRIPKDFAVGHLPNAINIPSDNFFDKKYFSKVEKDKILIVYGYDSSTPRLISLLSAHFKKENLYVAMGGYDFLKNNIIDKIGVFGGVYDDEVPLFNYSKKFSEIANSAGSSVVVKTKSAAAPKPVVRRKKKAVSGGCG